MLEGQTSLSDSLEESTGSNRATGKKPINKESQEQSARLHSDTRIAGLDETFSQTFAALHECNRLIMICQGVVSSAIVYA
jgi:hypothetical protein